MNGVHVVAEAFSIELADPAGILCGSDASLKRSAAPLSFVGGPENRLALRLADRALAPQIAYRPMVVYGPTGVGKTLLLHGLAAKRQQLFGDRHVYVTTGADFARSYAHAVDTDSLADFRAQLARSEIFVLDSLDELAGKGPAQRELCLLLDRDLPHTQAILISMRSAPPAASALKPSLRSRLAGGLVIPIHPPSDCCHPVLLERICRETVPHLSPGATEELVKRFPAARLTVPQLRQWVISRAAAPQLRSPVEPAPVGTRAKDASAATLDPFPLATICQTVARQHGLKCQDLRGPSRRQAVVQARNQMIYLARTLTPHSLVQVGRFLGGRDHTTVLHAYRKIRTLREEDPGIRQTLVDLESRLLSERMLCSTSADEPRASGEPTPTRTTHSSKTRSRQPRK